MSSAVLPNNNTFTCSPCEELAIAREGGLVTVRRISHNLMRFVEGRALIEKPAAGEHCFLVRFLGDPVARERFIHPDWHADPEWALAPLQQLWCTEATPAIADFFPADAP